jgi:hypothetical membrane protein
LDLDRIKRIYVGNYSRKYFKRYFLPISFITFFGFLLISRILYPGTYTIISNAISDLGNPLNNPFPGWLFFSIAFWVLASLYTPLILYIHRRLVQFHELEAKGGSILNFVAIVGMVLLGAFPDLPSLKVMHLIAAFLCFGCMSIAIVCYWIAVIHDSLQKALRFHHQGVFMILVFITLSIVAISFLGLGQLLSDLFPREFIWVLDYPVWEWGVFILLAFQLFFIGLIVPDQFPRSN